MYPTFRNPGDLGFDGDMVENAWLGLVHGAEREEYGGAVALVARHGQIGLYRATGWAQRVPDDQRSPMGADAIFDVASLTKVVATTPCILKLIVQEKIGLDQPVGDILPEFGTEGLKARVTIERLLTHSAGFRDWIPEFLEDTGEAAYLDAFAATQPEWDPGTRVVYSDPSFITLGAVVQRVTGEKLETYARREVFDKLRMVDTFYSPPKAMRGRIAATECGNAFEAAKAPGREPVAEPWRTSVIRGEVHDGNAWYGLGGVAGHAGLFSSAMDLYLYGQMWLNGGSLGDARILPETMVAVATNNQTAFDPDGSARGYGWRLLPAPGTPETTPDSGRGLSRRAYGHTGFTGTSLYIDPEYDLVVVILTNRVHPTVTTEYLETRAVFTNAIVDAIRE